MVHVASRPGEAEKIGRRVNETKWTLMRTHLCELQFRDGAVGSVKRSEDDHQNDEHRDVGVDRSETETHIVEEIEP